MAHNEQIFTPYWVVDLILDKIGYIGKNIRKKHIIDNSCGDGAFLCRIVNRYVDYCCSIGVSYEEIAEEIATYIHGIEIDEDLLYKCIEKLRLYEHDKIREMLKHQHLHSRVHLVLGDALQIDDFDNKMDFVVGNPPYCKVHDLKEKYDIVKQYSFTQEGMTDLYLAFFEKGLKMLKSNGVLAYITPNSWMTSKAGREFRNYLYNTKSLDYILQFGSEKVFSNATTFTNITIIDKNKTNNKFYWQYGKDGGVVESNIEKSFINGNLYLGKDEQLDKLKEILEYSSDKCKIDVKNGFATLKDKLFFVLVANVENTTKNYRPMIKASTGKLRMGFFPYDENGNPCKFEDLDEFTQRCLLERAYELDIDLSKTDWYLYGRSQGLRDFKKEKITINNIIKDVDSIKISKAEKYWGVYSGLYIVSNDNDELNEDYIQKILNQEDFIDGYVKLLGKYKNGGYYTFSSDDLKKYLNYYYKK